MNTLSKYRQFFNYFVNNDKKTKEPALKRPALYANESILTDYCLRLAAWYSLSIGRLENVGVATAGGSYPSG